MKSKGKKNICFIIQDVTLRGGEERMCSVISNFLVQHLYKVTVISLWSHKGSKPYFYYNDNVKVIYVLEYFLQRRIEQFLPFFHYLKRKIRRVIVREEADVVIDVDTRRTPLTTEAILGLDISHIAWDHFCFKHFQEEFPHVLPYLQNNVDKFVVLTKDDYRDYIQKAGIEANKVIQIYNPSPIELNEFNSHSRKKVLAMGRLENQKGFDRLLNIWSEIEKKDDEWILEIVGSGRKETELKQQSSNLNLKRVIFTPSTSNPIVKYKEASIFVLSSRFEGFVLVILEALNVSLPVVSFDCNNGPREIIKDGVNGYLIEDGNEKFFASRLLSLMNDSEKRNEMSHNCLDSVSSFKMENIGNQWISLIESL